MNPRILTELNAQGIAIFTKTPGGIYESINRAGADMIGHTFEEIVGRTDLELFDARSAQLMHERDSRLMKSDIMIHIDSIVRTDHEWMRFHSVKMGFGEGRHRLLIGLSTRLLHGRDQKRERVILEAARAIEQDPRALLQLMHDPQADLVFRPNRS